MKISDHIISKGTYQRHQINNFIAVKQYIFLRHDKQKYLLLRFSNDTEFTFSRLELELTQLDAEGNKLERSVIRSPFFSEPRGNIFSLSEGIRVNEKCVDFTVNIIAAYSDEYKYSVVNNEIAIFYQPTPVPKVRSDNPKNLKPIFSVRSRKGKPGALAVTVSIITALLLFALSAFIYYAAYLPWF